VLHPSKPREPRAQRRPVDIFFRSLAENQKERAIGIVFSGTGTNGAHGLRFIKSEGGITVAQDPATAAYAGMPQSAISTGIVDLVLPPEKMASALLDVARHPYVREPEAVEQPDVDGQLSAILALLRAQTDLDFQPYRRQTLLRRTHRRLGLHRIYHLSAYLERLRNDPQETTALARDLTINVSGFFRDPQAWSPGREGDRAYRGGARDEFGHPQLGSGLRYGRRSLFACGSDRCARRRRGSRSICGSSPPTLPIICCPRRARVCSPPASQKTSARSGSSAFSRSRTTVTRLGKRCVTRSPSRHRISCRIRRSPGSI
jgi:hypothetical protein